MNDTLKQLSTQVTKGLMTRREFVSRAAALGVTAAAANAMLTSPAQAQETPKRGGKITIGSSGGESTNTQDPALAASEVPVNNLYCWGEVLVEVDPTGQLAPRLAESFEASADATVWTFNIRKGVHPIVPIMLGDAKVAQPRSMEWNHSLGEIVTAVLDAGLELTSLTEHDSVPWDALPGFMVLDEQIGEYRLRERPERLPASFTLTARRR